MTMIERAFEMMSESIIIRLIGTKDREQRKRIAGELREYYLKKAELEGNQ